jgi:fatty acid desaturase
MFKSGRWNDWVSLVLANLFVGISYGWWQSKHTKHHANPNKDGHDPDIDLSAIAMTPERARRSSALGRWLVAHQGWYFFPLLLLEGVSLHWEAVKRVAGPGELRRRWVEIALLTVRFGGLTALVFGLQLFEFPPPDPLPVEPRRPRLLLRRHRHRLDARSALRSSSAQTCSNEFT